MRLYLVVLLFLISPPMIFAEDIILTVEQSDYYFQTGESAIIPLEIQNYNDHQISGLLQYIITQQVTQANAQFSSSNTQATTLAIDAGNHTITLDFGTRAEPHSLTADLSFIYNNGTQISASLDPITIHFVADPSQKQDMENQMQSTSQQQPSTQNTPSPSQSVQEKLDEILNQQPSQDPQQRLQNNQLPQDNTGLKQEIQEQLRQENDIKQAFEEQLASNPDFQEPHQQLLEQGYDVTDARLDPSTEETGDFELDYQNEQGEWAQLSGQMTNGTVTEIQQQTQEQTESLLKVLRAHPDFIGYDEQLRMDNFTEGDVEFVYAANKTTIQVPYHGVNNHTASIYGEFESDILEDVFLERSDGGFDWLLLAYASGIAIISYVVYRLYKKRQKPPAVPVLEVHSEPYDEGAVERLIKEGKADFEANNYKDAYGKINQALRLFLSRELNLKKETTNENILEHIPSESFEISDIKECFRIASLVEFAKYAPNRDDFSKIVSITENIIRRD